MRVLTRNRPRVQSAEAYKAQESAAEQELAKGLERLAREEAGDSWRGNAALDDDFGRMSKEELHQWMLNHGFRLVPAPAPARLQAGARYRDPGQDEETDSQEDVAATEEGAQAGAEGGAGDVLHLGSDDDSAHGDADGERLCYAISLDQPDHDFDWAPYLPADWPTQEARDLWTQLQGIVTPKDLAGVAAHILGSQASFPEEWPEERKTRDLEPFWLAYQAALSAGVVQPKRLTHDIEHWLSRNIKGYPPPDPLDPLTPSASSTAPSHTAREEQAPSGSTRASSAAHALPLPAADDAPEQAESGAPPAQGDGLNVGDGAGKIGGMLSGFASSLKRGISGFSESLPELPDHVSPIKHDASQDPLLLRVDSAGEGDEVLPAATKHDTVGDDDRAAGGGAAETAVVSGDRYSEEMEEVASEEDQGVVSSADAVRSSQSGGKQGAQHDEEPKHPGVEEEQLLTVPASEGSNEAWAGEGQGADESSEAGGSSGTLGSASSRALDSSFSVPATASQKAGAASVINGAIQAATEPASEALTSPPPADDESKELAIEEPTEGGAHKDERAEEGKEEVAHATQEQVGGRQERDSMDAAAEMLEDLHVDSSTAAELADEEDALVAEPLRNEEAMGTTEVQETAEVEIPGQVYVKEDDTPPEVATLQQGQAEQGSGVQMQATEVTRAPEYVEAEDAEEYEQVREAVKKLQVSDEEQRARIERAWLRSLLQVLLFFLLFV